MPNESEAMAKKRKFPKRKRRFSLQTPQGKQLALMHSKLYGAFPKDEDRTAYLKACIKELDRLIEIKELEEKEQCQK